MPLIAPRGTGLALLVGLTLCATARAGPDEDPGPPAGSVAERPDTPAVLSLEGGAYGLDWTRDGTGFVVGGVGESATDGAVSAWSRSRQRRWRGAVRSARVSDGGRGLAPSPSQANASVRVVRHLHHSDRVLVADDYASVRILDSRTGGVLARLGVLGTRPEDACQQDPATFPDGGELVRRWCGVTPEWATAGAISVDDRRAAVTGIVGTLTVWDLERGEPLSLPAPLSQPGRLEDVSFSPDGRWLAVAGQHGDTPVVVYDLLNQTVRQVPWVPRSTCTWGQAVAFSPDGDRLAIGCWGGALEVQSFPEGQTLWHASPGHPNWTWPLTFTPDGRFLLARTAHKLHRYEVESGLHLQRDLPQSADMRVSPDGTTLAVPVNQGGGEIHLVALPSLRDRAVDPHKPVPESAQPTLLRGAPATLGPFEPPTPVPHPHPHPPPMPDPG